MLELIQEELRNKGISKEQFITFNFESLANAEFCTAQTLYTELKRRVESIQGKAYCFFDEIQEVEAWEKCIRNCFAEDMMSPLGKKEIRRSTSYATKQESAYTFRYAICWHPGTPSTANLVPTIKLQIITQNM